MRVPLLASLANLSEPTMQPCDTDVPQQAAIRIIVDGAAVDIAAGATALDAVRRSGVQLPTLCHDDRLAPVGHCWSCVVQFRASPAAAFADVPACRTALQPGCEIRTSAEATAAFRRGLLQRLAERVAPEDMRRFPDKALHRALRSHGIAPAGPAQAADHIDASHPYIRVDMSRCISCVRCVRVCDDVQGESVWHLFGRGDATRVSTAGDVPLAQSACVGCGACVDACPTAALTDAAAWRLPRASAVTRTICPYCAVGCDLEIGVAEDGIVAARPAADAPANRGHACVKGRYAHGYVDAADRVTLPGIRRAGRWLDADWNAAIAEVAGGLRRIMERHGADAVGVLASARATNEENYLTQKFARVALGTHNVDSCARVCHAPSAVALKRMLGTGAATNSFDDIEQAAALLVIGANPLENHPVVGARIRLQRRHGARLIVVDPRRTALAEIADVHLALRPGTDVALLNALAHVVLAEELEDREYIADRASGLDAFARAVQTWTPERAAAVCGVDAAAIRQAARLYAGARPALCVHGLGLTEHRQGTQGVMAVANLALLTGNIGKPGAGVNPLRGQNNVQGAAHMGCEPHALTGAVPIETGRARFERAWNCVLPRTRGLDALQMIDGAAAGTLKALYVIGFDVLASLPHTDRVAAALARLELIVVQDLFLTATAATHAHVFLPAASSYEKDGTFMNSERRIQRVRRVVSTRGQARTDAEIIVDLAAALGHAAQFRTAEPAAVWDEIRRLWPAGAGITYARIEDGGLQWPCRDEADPGTPVLHVGGFAHARRATLEPIDYLPTDERPDEHYPFLLTTGRALDAFNVATMTGRTPQLALRPTDTLDMHPYDAQQLQLEDGMDVRVRSRYGEAVLPLRITTSVASGQLFATFHDPSRAVNRLTGDARDGMAGTPEYKVTAVRVWPASGGGLDRRQVAPLRRG